MWVDCIVDEHHKLRSDVVFLINQCKYSISGGTYCVQGLKSIHVHQRIKLQIWSNAEWRLVSLQLITQPTLPINFHLINSCVKSHALKLLKLHRFSAVSLYTQQPFGLYKKIQLLSSLQSLCIVLCIFVPYFIIKTHHERHVKNASFTTQFPLYDASTSHFNWILSCYQHSNTVFPKIKCCGK